MKRIFSVLVCVSVCLGAVCGEAVKRELRSVWLATVSNIDWPTTRGTGADAVAKQKQQLLDLIDGFARCRMNCVYFQVRPMADALYKSSYEPWSQFLTGTRGTDPGWDPLAFAVEECHKRGIECHAWLNPYRFSNNSGTDRNTAFDNGVKQQGVLLQSGKYVVFNPALQWTRDHIKSVCRDILGHYDIDGIIFDDYFYPSEKLAEDSSAPDYALWLENGGSMSIADWRRDNVNRMVREVAAMMREEWPQARFGISPAGIAGTANTSAGKHGVTPCPVGSDWQYNGIYSDPLAWLEEGTIDYISPQLYSFISSPTKPFGTLNQWWNYIADHYGRPEYPGMGISSMSESNTVDDWREMHNQIVLTRRQAPVGESGVVFFSARYLYGPGYWGLGDYLANNTFIAKALPPYIKIKGKPEIATPMHLSLDGGTLQWTGTDQHLMRYAIYAIPTSVAQDEVMSETYGGIKGDYLAQVIYESSWNVPDSMLNGYYWWAVTAVDGWGNESAPAYLNVPHGNATATTLVSPIGGDATQWQQEFKWNEVPGSRYRVQIAGDEEFDEVVIDLPGLETTSTTVDVSALSSNTVYYWRVFTSQPGCVDAPSAVATFTTGQRPLATAATLVRPADGNIMGNDFNFMFTPSDAESFVLQVSRTPQFDDIVLTVSDFVKSANNLIAPVRLAQLGMGRFYWRVMSHAAGRDDASSLVRTFDIVKLPVGHIEKGYVIKQDVDTYDAVDGVTLTNQWMRSVKDEYANILFDSDGQMNRGFTVKGDRIYVIGRDKTSSEANVYIDAYSAYTGEHLKRQPVSRYVHAHLYPGNDIFKDNAGHLLVSNLCTDVAQRGVVIHQVDPETGFVIERARITCDVLKNNRIDHCNVYGDVESGQFYVFAAPSAGTQVVRWTVSDGVVTETKVMNAVSFSPSRVSSWGTAPRVFPVSPNLVYVKGVGEYVTLYDMTTGRIVDSMDGNAAIMPAGTTANGFADFALVGKHYRIYPDGDYRSAQGFRFSLVKSEGEDKFSDFKMAWSVPRQGFGNLANGGWDALCDVTDGLAPNQKNVFLYVPGNGLACYTLEAELRGDINGDGVADVTDANILINIILGKDDASRYEGRADVDHSGTVDIQDLNATLNILLGK
ncbi:MAG: family 10 glycosylhydrolase [Muribaculaceae bacterium]|nr:family 10 glycosylhydrolase [Muribaculaceae bacterium]